MAIIPIARTMKDKNKLLGFSKVWKYKNGYSKEENEKGAVFSVYRFRLWLSFIRSFRHNCNRYNLESKSETILYIL